MVAQRLALVRNGIVVNVIKAGDNYEPPDGHTLVTPTAGVGPGWSYDGESFTAPEAPPPAPDVGGYLLAAYAEPPTGIGEDRARLVGRDWQDGILALQRGNWAIARAVVDKMLANTNEAFVTITEQEHTTLLALMDTYGIPEE